MITDEQRDEILRRIGRRDRREDIATDMDLDVDLVNEVATDTDTTPRPPPASCPGCGLRAPYTGQDATTVAYRCATCGPFGKAKQR